MHTIVVDDRGISKRATNRPCDDIRDQLRLFANYLLISKNMVKCRRNPSPDFPSPPMKKKKQKETMDEPIVYLVHIIGKSIAHRMKNTFCQTEVLDAIVLSFILCVFYASILGLQFQCCLKNAHSGTVASNVSFLADFHIFIVHLPSHRNLLYCHGYTSFH